MRDELIVFALLSSFAILATSHIAIVAGLARRPERHRAPIALFIAPLAPYWALREKMWMRGIGWIGCAVVYAMARVLAE